MGRGGGGGVGGADQDRRQLYSGYHISCFKSCKFCHLRKQLIENAVTLSFDVQISSALLSTTDAN